MDKPPQLKITDAVKSVKEVSQTKPAANSIAFHWHGNELAITLEGTDLWFVSSIQVGLLENLCVSAKATNQNVIQFNLPYKPDQGTDDEVDVIVESQFYEPIKCSLKVTKKVKTKFLTNKMLTL